MATHEPTRDAEWLSHQIVQHAPEAVIMADREGLIRVWNAGLRLSSGTRRRKRSAAAWT
jgi:PAS domain-containing protein